jgi:outer membrane lipoprotein-sorting protein
MIYPIPRRFIVILVLVLLSCSTASAQQDGAPKPSPENTAKAELILNRAIEVLGGNAYLNVKTVVGRGFFSTFNDGISQNPARFLDYIAYPDRERTEFTGNGIRVIQINTGDTGWLYDGATKSFSDQKGQQIEDFKRGMRTSVENLLHGWWKKEKATLSYIGRREAGLARRNEVLRLTYPDGFWIEYEFAVKEGLPEKVIFKTSKKKPDSDETVESTEEDRLQKPIAIAGVTSPWVIDHFTNGIQSSRINYESVEYNTPLADSLFAKPANIKALK